MSVGRVDHELAAVALHVGGLPLHGDPAHVDARQVEVELAQVLGRGGVDGRDAFQHALVGEPREVEGVVVDVEAAVPEPG